VQSDPVQSDSAAKQRPRIGELILEQIERLRRVRAERDGAAVEAALDALTCCARTGERNLLNVAVDAAAKRATLGEISTALEKVWGRYDAPVRSIHGVYAAESQGEMHFEEARKLTAEFAEVEGRRPRILVAKIGIPSFIATLASQFFWAGMATVLSGGKSYALRGAEQTSVWYWLVGRLPDAGGAMPWLGEVSIQSQPPAFRRFASAMESSIVQPPSTQSLAEMRTPIGLSRGHTSRTAQNTSNGKRMRLSNDPPYASLR